ncbi:OprO/OprP family phosphate-selective porin, partial [Akkermansiaceae bacterium]|nr:OprO/OprP family phosphate-selective porin [Akkermansiaceae bacterium]
MNTKMIITASLAVSTLSALADGGAVILAPEPINNGNWCDSLKDIGTVYKDKSNPYIQEVKFFGRAHYQWGYTDGEYNGLDFDGNGDELRRFRVGTSVKFLNGFKLAGRVNLEEGGFRDTDFGFGGFDELYLNYVFGDVLGLEDVSVGYGRYKMAFGGEEHTSSKKIKTVERSNINNIFAPRRATGAIIGASFGDVDYTASVFSTDRNAETFGSWNGGNRSGIGYILSAEFEALGGDVTADAMFYDGAVGNDVSKRVKWAGSLTYETEIGNWDLFTNATYGEVNGEDVYGIVIMPSTYLVEDKLEAVFRYQYANSTADSIGINSRNVRNVAANDTPVVTVGAGDINHTIYAGLNYYLCGHNAKVMAGVEYETLSG